MGELAGIVLLTLGVALAATALVSVPGLAIAYWLARPPSRSRATSRSTTRPSSATTRSIVEALVSLPLVLPPTAIGFGLLLLFGANGVLGRHLAPLGLRIAFDWKGVVIASAVVALPLFVRSVRSAFEEIDPELVGVARSLGRRRIEAFFAVELPLAWRGVAAGSVLAFARALGEFGATIVLAGNIPGRTQTLALALYQRVQVGRDAEALAIAGISAGLGFLALLIVNGLTRRRDQRLER